MSSPYEEFRRDLMEGQKKANKTNSLVTVTLRGQQVRIEPNAPKFLKKDVDKRYAAIMSVDLEDSEMIQDSVSILARPSRNKRKYRILIINTIQFKLTTINSQQRKRQR